MTRDRAIQVLREMKNLTYVATDSRCSAIDMAIESLSADEVVRCKDCRHAEHREQMPNQVYCKRDKLSAFCSPHDDDDFCKYGERREP